MIHKLFTNHLDAWGSTLVISSVAILLHQAITLQNMLLMVAITLVYWLAFAVNDYFDAEIDAYDPRKAENNFFVQHQLTVFQWLLAGSIGGSFLLWGMLTYRWAALMPLCVGVFVLWGYSAPPLRLKSRPGLDLLTHALFVQTFPYFLTVYLIDDGWLVQDVAMLSVFFCASLAAQLEQQARDFELDAQHETNFTIHYGKPIGRLLIGIASLAVMVLSLTYAVTGVLPLFLVPIGLIALPAFLHRFVRQADTPRSETLIHSLIKLALIYLVVVWLAQLL